MTTPNKPTPAQHQALGALFNRSSTDTVPAGSIRPDRWGLDAINTRHTTWESLVRHGWVMIDERTTNTTRRLAHLTTEGYHVLREADHRLIAQTRAETNADPHALTQDEHTVLYRMVHGPGHITALTWEEMDYLLRLRLKAKGYVRRRADGAMQMTERAAAAFTARTQRFHPRQ